MTDYTDLVNDLRANSVHGRGIDLRDAADAIEALQNHAVLKQAECDGIGSLLLDVQRDCIQERARAEKAEAEILLWREAFEKDDRDTRYFSKAMRAQAKVARLRAALEVAKEDFYESYNQWNDEDYTGPVEGFSVPVVGHIKPYFDIHLMRLEESAQRVIAALAQTAQEGDEE